MPNRVFVIGADKRPLMPCHPARARKLLKKGRAVVWRMAPFTIMMLDRTASNCEPNQLESRRQSVTRKYSRRSANAGNKLPA